jgi:diguanylate cyclase (GGDEF)-like protein
MSGLATGLDVAALIATPSSCQLTFSGLGVFPVGHIDVVLPNGRVPCTSVTSRGAPAGATHRGAAWVTNPTSRKGPAISSVFRDGLSGRVSLAITAPVLANSRDFAALVAVVVPVGNLARGLADAYGGPDHFTFTVRDRNGQLLAAPTSASTSHGGQISAVRTIPGLGWQLTAAESSDTALAASHTVFWRIAALGAGAVLVLLLLLFAVNRRIANPLRRLTAAVTQASRRQQLDPVDVGGPRELRAMVQEFNAMVAARASYEYQLAHHALHDPLTGLPNRALFLDRTDIALLGARADASSSIVVFSIDLDRFKVVNTSLGYPSGDAVLLEAADRLQAVCRAGDTVARCGDGYLICQPGSDAAERALSTAARLLDCLGLPFEAGQGEVTLSASVGVAIGRANLTASQLVNDADIAMHAAKEAGGGRYRLIDDELRVASGDRLSLESDLRIALRDGQLHVEYQPVVDLVTGRITGAEALLRWAHPLRGAVPPLTFVPLAEQSDLIHPLGRFVLDAACAQAAVWNAMGHELRMSVNVSGRQLTDPSFVGHVAHALDNSGLPAGQLCLELTETVLMDDAMKSEELLTELKAFGVDISVDDFGTGYSSLAYLNRFPVDEVKIDRTFVQNLDHAQPDSTLVAAMVAMGHALGLQVVAEGIETERQAMAIRTLGCRSAQGYLFSRPRTSADFSTLLVQGRANKHGRDVTAQPTAQHPH